MKKITFYTDYPDIVDIRPMDMKRDWMDDTTKQFAYRCLPLNIANTHGWSVHLKASFVAKWDGGPSPESLKIISIDPMAEQFAVSHFGHGVLTFKMLGLFRTEPGWNLYVGGPPNNIKDGISPLNGVVETDWSPYSFTMNWKITRPNTNITFKKGEPICSFFPIQRGLLEGVEPEIRTEIDDPDFARQNELFRESRNQLICGKENAPSQEKREEWQKGYFQGRMPDGSPGCPAHQTKLRVPPFVKKTAEDT